MKFNKVDVELPELKQVNLPEGRRYVNEDGVSYPSVTTVLSASQNKDYLDEWRKAVGDKEANRVSHHASTQGTAVHDSIENYILNRRGKSVMPHVIHLYKKLKQVADEHIGDVYATEAMLMSNHLKTAGSVDCVAVFDGVLSIIDWKTSKTPKERDDIHDYFMQESFYAVAFEETTGIPVPQLVTVMTCETGQSIIFKEKRDDWIDKFKEKRKLFDTL